MKPTTRLGKTATILFYPFVFVLALLLILEEWLWFHTLIIMNRIGQLPIIKQIEAFLRGLPTYVALVALCIPWLILLPVKFLAMGLVAHHQPALGLVVLLAAKVIGTAILARLFSLTRDQVLKIVWFKKLYELILRMIAWAKEIMRQSKAYQLAHRQVQQTKLWWQQRRAGILGRFFRSQVRKKKNDLQNKN